MSGFYVRQWSALAPGLTTSADWVSWLQRPFALPISPSVDLKILPPMMRRRLSPLGKLALAAAIPLLTPDESLPMIFVSRHGDTLQTLGLLQTMVRGESLSPTAFSLAVHNAISGIFTIARRDISAVTALASMDNLALSMLFEAIGQLQEAPRILCVLCDSPLPEYYQASMAGPEFPYALAMVLCRDAGAGFSLDAARDRDTPSAERDPIGLIRLLVGLEKEVVYGSDAAQWVLTRQDVVHVPLS